MINLHCPQCGAEYELDDSLAGRRVECSECGHHFAVADAVDAIAPDAAPEEAQAPSPNAAKFDRAPSGCIVCPHCWKRFDYKDINYIARHVDLIGDPVLGPDAKQRFLPIRFSARGMAIDSKGMECPEMACPHCHLPIPESMLELPTSIFSIVGEQGTGKSYFLTTMIWNIRQLLPKFFEFNIHDVDSTFNATLNEYEKILFMSEHPDRIVALPKTGEQGSGFTDEILMDGFPVQLPKPFIFAINPMSGHPRYETGRKELERNIILYDNAGELFRPGSETVTNLGTNHLSFSDGIIFIYDPLMDNRMQVICDRNDPQFRQQTCNQLALFHEMAARIRKFSGLQAAEKYRRPLIVAIAKFDVLAQNMGMSPGIDDYLEYDAEKFEYSLNIQNITNVSFMLREQLLEIAPEFVAAVEGFSETVFFVPVSAFGCSPEVMEGGALGIVPEKIKPFWTEVPFLLHLYLHGMIPGVTTRPKDAVPIGHCKFTKDTIVFAFPGSGRRCELPSTYWGMSLYCKDERKYYQLPVPGDGRQVKSFKAAGLDEQIDVDFWSKQ